MVGDDEIIKYLRATTNSDKGALSLKWWRRNMQQFPHIAAATWRLFAIKSSSEFSESVFSVSGNGFDAEITGLSDECITACMWVRAWKRLLESSAMKS